MSFEEKWASLLNPKRRNPEKNAPNPSEIRTEPERDYDRILFSTPVRRLADKTQVFPLERHDSVRTRLTHSHEVSNLARSIGTGLVHKATIGHLVPNSKRNIPSILAAVGLAHDLGNPPFGHQGESAIQQWFSRNEKSLFKGKRFLNPELFNDFLKFEGNAQALRVVTRLQLLDHDYGLDLTVASLASLMKYTADSSTSSKSNPHCAQKKPGYFQSEKNIAAEVLSEVGLKPGQRHPLAYIMEACDDIAYSVLDVEDAVKKSILSFHDVIGYLDIENKAKNDPLIGKVLEKAREKYQEYRDKGPKLSPSELGDISMQRLRVEAIMVMINAVHEIFVANQELILSNEHKTSLIEASKANFLVDRLVYLARTRAYSHKSVLEIELKGYNILQELMDMLWYGISHRESFGDLDGKRKSPYAKFIYGRISENYRRVFQENKENLPVAYKEAQLLTDMVAGMTDTFAIDLHAELKSHQDLDFKKFSNAINRSH